MTKVTVDVYAKSQFPLFQNPVPGKVALLIANEKYENMPNLNSPSQDMKKICTIFKRLGFRTLTLKDLGLQEMHRAVDKFTSTVVLGAYVVFYYAGHGFEFGNKFLLPVDSPAKYRLQDCVCHNHILKEIWKRKPEMFLFILDMCNSFPDKNENEDLFKEQLEVYDWKPDRSLIQCSSTTSGLSSYEHKGGSLYTNTLCEYLSLKCSSSPVLDILNTVNAEFYKLHKDVEQMPLVSYNTVKDYMLGVPVVGGSKDVDDFYDDYESPLSSFSEEPISS